jgi:2-amino-4-hydroxy-6-hydroxymethyldihydropteridine diphosphokinase
LQQQVYVTAVSTFYQTPPIDRPQQDDYLNGVFEIYTDLAPENIKPQIFEPIETQLGRIRMDDPYAPRTMDLDLILYNDIILNQPQIQLPHLDLQRPFVWIPIQELLEQGTSRPDLRKRILDLLPKEPASKDWGKPLQVFTQELRKMLSD